MRTRLNFIRNLYGAVFILIALFIPRLTQAAEWSVQPSLQLGREYNDNLQLTIQPHTSVTGTMIAPKMDLTVSSSVWQLSSGVEAVQKRYSGAGDIDRDDRFYNLGAFYKTERSIWQLATSSSKNSTLADERVRSDTGLVQVQRTYDTRMLNPSWIWSMNELTQLQFSYSLNNVSYVNGQNLGLNDYSARSISTQLTNQLNPQDQVFITVGYSMFTVPATTFESNSATYQLGASRNFSEKTKGTLSIGMRKTSSKQNVNLLDLGGGTVIPCPGGIFSSSCRMTAIFSHESSSVFSGSLEKQYETTHLTLTFSRAFDASGLGGQVRTDAETVALSRQLSTRLTGVFSAGNYNYRSETGSLAGVDRNLYTMQPGLDWAWTPELNINLSLQYMHIKWVQIDKPAFSRAAYLTLRYGWPKMAFSR